MGLEYFFNFYAFEFSLQIISSISFDIIARTIAVESLVGSNGKTLNLWTIIAHL